MFSTVNYAKHFVYKRLPFRSNLLSRYKSKVSLQVQKNVTRCEKPTGNLSKIINDIQLKFPNISVSKLNLQRVSFKDKSKQWKATYTLKGQEDFLVEGIAQSKIEAEKLASLNVVQKFKELGVLDDINDSTTLNPTKDELRNAKIEFSNIYSMVAQKFGRNFRAQFQHTAIKSFKNRQIIGWKTVLRLEWPKIKTLECNSTTKLQSENILALKVIDWLSSEGKLDEKRNPILYSNQENEEFIDGRTAPLPVEIPGLAKSQLKIFLEKLKNEKPEIEAVIASRTSKSILITDFLESSLDEDDNNIEFKNVDHSQSTSNDVNDDLINDYISRRSSKLFRSLKKRHISISDSEINFLPIKEHRSRILKLISENRVIVLSGEPGCGKTTQVPQYILDDWTIEGKGGDCQIVITQPRRLATISMAHRIAQERNEKIGDTIGYQIRLQSVMPPSRGSVLFCSTGILLHRLRSNPDLQGVTHVIVDEVHEREMQTDFLLILLKDILNKNETIKLILMSASLNAEMFSKYFDDCPIICVPGFVYPVVEKYLPEINEKVIKHTKNVSSMKTTSELEVNHALVVDTIRHIDKNKPNGAILCFLPGWQDIKTVAQILRQTFINHETHIICLVHSSLPNSEQQQIFNVPPLGVRKIILSTNIAETSVTINDVVYVVDSGLHKVINYDSSKGLARLGTSWISRANAKQRKGRAGRVQSGICYRLYTEEHLKCMSDFSSPEILESPLEKVILDSKIFCPNTSAEEFLSRAPQPPSSVTINRALKELGQLGILNSDESLTILGEKVAALPTHPRLAVALIASAFLGCSETILNIVAILSNTQNIFNGNPNDGGTIKKIKQEIDQNRSLSDHLVFSSVLNAWTASKIEDNSDFFCSEHSLRESSVHFAAGLKNIFKKHLNAINIKIEDDYVNTSESKDKNDAIMSIAALCYGLYPNLVRIHKGIRKRSHIKQNVILPVTLDGQLVCFPNESLISKEKSLDYPWLIYFDSIMLDSRKQLMIRDASPVSSLHLLLLGSKRNPYTFKVTKNELESEEQVLFVLDNHRKLRFVTSLEDAELITEFRECFNLLFEYFLVNNELKTNSDNLSFNSAIEELRNQLCAMLIPSI